MRRLLKRISSFFLIPLTRWYLKKERRYTRSGTTVTILPGVFHPGLFHSTRFLLDYLDQQTVSGSSLLELGCGSGLISVVMAKRGAVVTATDLNEKAIDNTRLNAAANSEAVTVIHADLFDGIAVQQFDWIIINPPYYRQEVKTAAELAWNAGLNFDYFQRLFFSLGTYMHPKTNVIMVLTLGTELGAILEIGVREGFTFQIIAEQRRLFDEKDILYRVIRALVP